MTALAIVQTEVTTLTSEIAAEGAKATPSRNRVQTLINDLHKTIWVEQRLNEGSVGNGLSQAQTTVAVTDGVNAADLAEAITAGIAAADPISRAVPRIAQASVFVSGPSADIVSNSDSNIRIVITRLKVFGVGNNRNLNVLVTDTDNTVLDAVRVVRETSNSDGSGQDAILNRESWIWVAAGKGLRVNLSTSRPIRVGVTYHLVNVTTGVPV